MDTRLTSTHRCRWPLIASMVMLSMLMALGATSVSAAASDCRVRNTETGTAYHALQAAVDAASDGDRLTVKGTCIGKTVIDRDLVIEGIRTATTGTPTLSGSGYGSVVRVIRGLRVHLRDLVIRDGRARRTHASFLRRLGRMGGGINNRGTLTLLDVVVRANVAGYGGGGIWTDGTLTLNGNSRVSGNSACFGGGVYLRNGSLILNGISRIAGNTSQSGGESGGGVYSYGVPYTWRCRIVMNGGSSIVGNATRGEGGGVMNGFQCAMTLNGRSSVAGNSASAGGGITSYGRLTLNDRSAVSGNQADGLGGGVANLSRLTMNDDSSISSNAAGGWGGGIVNASGEVVELRGRSSVSGNTATSGGGIQNWGTFKMYGTSRVSGNTALGRTGDVPGEPLRSLVPDGMGGGVFNSERMVLRGASSIDGNTAHDGGGGVAHIANISTNIGLQCGPGGNVHGNSPDDCRTWQWAGVR